MHGCIYSIWEEREDKMRRKNRWGQIIEFSVERLNNQKFVCVSKRVDEGVTEQLFAGRLFDSEEEAIKKLNNYLEIGAKTGIYLAC